MVAGDAARALGALGKKAGPSVGALVNTLSHEDPYVRIYAAEALASIGPTAARATTALASALDDPIPGVRWAACEARRLCPRTRSAPYCFARRPSNARNRMVQGACQGRCRPGRGSDRWTPGPRPRRCGRMDPRAKDIDESADRRAGSLAQRAQGPCGIARDHRILVSQCPSQRRLNPFCMGRQVNQGIGGVAPEGVPLVPKQVHQQRNGRRTDAPDDLESHPMQVFMQRVEKSSEQRERTPRPFDQGGFGGCADLRVVGQQAIGPVTDRGGVSGRTRLRPGQR